MIFHSIDFLLFLPIVVIGARVLPHALRNWFLLIASYFFYAYHTPWYAILLFGSTLVTFWAAELLKRRPAEERIWLFLGVGVPFLLLVFYKYTGFLLQNLSELLRLMNAGEISPFAIALPVGISFSTFQAGSYVFDVARGDLKPAKKFRDYALYHAFFPQLVAGPIERATALLPQIEADHRLQLKMVRSALVLICWGYFKKLVIADNLAVISNKIFALGQPGMLLVWAGTLAFGMQIYADFSGYTDIARGVARLLGFELMKNFNHPYLALSPVDFWRRWHISLSTWFRDYLYIPLGGNRFGVAKTIRNTFITFLLCGLWHGASWNFVLWGGYHALLLVGTRFFTDLGIVPPKAVRWLLTFILVHFGWLLFRETNLSQLVADIALSDSFSQPGDAMIAGYFAAVTAFFAFPLFIHPLVERWAEHIPYEGKLRVGLDTAFCGTALSAMLVFYSRTQSDFIYFQF